jgi:hypothetical protein
MHFLHTDIHQQSLLNLNNDIRQYQQHDTKGHQITHRTAYRHVLLHSISDPIKINLRTLNNST